MIFYKIYFKVSLAINIAVALRIRIVFEFHTCKNRMVIISLKVPIPRNRNNED